MIQHLNKENNKDLAEAVQQLYISTRKFNTIAGNGALNKERIPNQVELVLAELKETNEALLNEDLVELVDGCADLGVTLSELVMLIDGNTSLLEDAPKYLNNDNLSVEEIVALINVEVGDNNYIDALNYVEDLASQLNADMVYSLASVADSNLSKFITEEELLNSNYNALGVCDLIQQQGRYENVYFEVVEYEGVKYVVFKSKYDKKNDESYPSGKVIKCPLTFKEPEIVIYE